MDIAITIGFYAWITLLHCLFVGVTVHAILGRSLWRNTFWKPYIICLLFLAFIEVYWIIPVEHLGAQLTIESPQVLAYFHLQTGQNIEPLLHPSWVSFIIWGLQAWLANVIGNKLISKIIKA